MEIMKYENLYKLRKENKKSQKEISKLLNMTGPNYSKYELGESEISAKHLVKLAKYYGVSIDYILGHQPKGQIVLPPLNEVQINAIKTILQLNTENQYNALGYASALAKTK